LVNDAIFGDRPAADKRDVRPPGAPIPILLAVASYDAGRSRRDREGFSMPPGGRSSYATALEAPRATFAIDDRPAVVGALALPSITLVEAPPRRLHVLWFWGPVVVLLAIACFGAEHWQRWFGLLPQAVRRAVAAPGYVEQPLAACEASVFLACLVVLLWRNLGLFRQVVRMLQPGDLRAALYAIAALQCLSFVTRPSSFGVDYQILSLHPFGQATGVFNRRILDVALAYYLHLSGGLFIVLHVLTVFALLALTRAYLRRRGAEPNFLCFVSLATSSFVIFNFQYPGYPDPLVLVLVLIALSAALDIEGLALLVVLALLTHEALAAALFLPLLPALARRVWPVVLLPFAIYGLFWLADFGFDPFAGWSEQVHFHGLSGPEALARRPLVILFGVAAAGKLLWLAVGEHLVFAARRFGPAALARLAAPLLGMAAICVLSYDTSRMAEVGFPTLLLAWSGCVARWPRRAILAVAIANLALPSVYVSPYFENALGVMWPPGLYAAYHGFRADTIASP
jgi:hypothetical protein